MRSKPWRSRQWRSRQSAVGSRQSALTTDNRQPTTRSRSGFTLVELLVVIVIIIILMGLLTPVLILALARAREGRIIAEVSNLDGGIKAYKERFGSYPPSDFSNLTTTGPVAIHLQRAFPRCNVQNELNWLSAAGGASLSPPQALAFWLGGFTSDPEHPLSAMSINNSTTNTYAPNENLPPTPLYQFEATRLVNSSSSSSNPAIVQHMAVYVPADGLGSPYVYFAAQNYLNTSGGWALPFPGTTWTNQGGQGTCRPYLADNTSVTSGQVNFVNPSSFQIISAGLDGNYGNGLCSYPSGLTTNGPSGVLVYSPFDADNLTNFSSKNLLDAVPQ